MRPSLRFFSSCSTSSVIISSIKHEVVTGNAAQDHAFEAIKIIETVVSRLFDGGQQRRPWIVTHQLQQLTQRQADHLTATLLERRDIVSQLRSGLEDRLFLGMRIAALDTLPARR